MHVCMLILNMYIYIDITARLWLITMWSLNIVYDAVGFVSVWYTDKRSSMTSAFWFASRHVLLDYIPDCLLAYMYTMDRYSMATKHSYIVTM